MARINNIIKRGLGKLQSLVTRGFSGKSVTVSDAAGSVIKLFPRQRHILKKYSFDLNGVVAIKKTLNLTIQGVCRCFSQQVFSIVATIKTAGIYTFNAVAKVKLLADYGFKAIAKTKIAGSYTLNLPKRYKVGQLHSFTTKGLNRFVHSLGKRLSGVNRHKLSLDTTFSGYKLNRMKKEHSFGVKGRKNLMKLLLSLGMFNKIPK